MNENLVVYDFGRQAFCKKCDAKMINEQIVIDFHNIKCEEWSNK